MKSPRNPDNVLHNLRAGAITVVIVILVVLGLLILVIVATSDKSDNSTTDSGGNKVCFTYCIGLVELECGTGKLMGACFGAWDCTSETGRHPCR